MDPPIEALRPGGPGRTRTWIRLPRNGGVLRDPQRTIAARLHGGRGLVACLEPVRLVFTRLFETGGAALGCGRPRTSSLATRAASCGPRRAFAASALAV